MVISQRKKQRLEEKMYAALPKCRAFVSRLWGVPESKADPRQINGETKESPSGKAKASANSHSREIVFWEPSFRRMISPSKHNECTLVHELTHLATIPPLPSRRGLVRSCLVEGTATFSALFYYKTQVSLWRKLVWANKYFCNLVPVMVAFPFLKASTRSKFIPQTTDFTVFDEYSIGHRFIRSLYDAALPPEKILYLISKSPPRFEELFLPVDYLERIRVPHKVSHKSTLPDITKWINDAVKEGLKKAKEYQNDPGPVENSDHVPMFQRIKDLGQAIFALASFPILSVINQFVTLYRHFFPKLRAKGAPQHLLPNSAYYGTRFVTLLYKQMGQEKTRRLIRDHPPSSIAHIMDPDSYLRGSRRSYFRYSPSSRSHPS